MSRSEILLEALMNRAGKAGDAEYEVYVVRKNSLAIAVKEGQVDQVRRNQELAAALRFIDQGRLGFGYTSDFSPEALDRLIEQAAAGARLTDPQPGLALPSPPASGAWPEVNVYDPELSEIPLPEKIEQVRKMEAAALDLDPRVERVRQSEYEEAESAVWLANSHGLTYHHAGTAAWGSVMVKVVEGAEAEMGYEFDFARRYRALDLVSVGRKAAERALRSLGGRKVASGRKAVLLENSVVAEFLEVLSSSFLADNIQKGKSMLAGRLGEPIMSPRLTLLDDGLREQGLATSPADAEGTPKRKTVLVDQGVLNGFLYDLHRAGLDGTASTGNAVRGDFKSPPSIGTTNFHLAAGESSPEQLARSLGEGLLVTEAMGVHTADPISGDFSFGVSGVWIRNGQPEYPVKGMALAGNVFELFRRTAEVGSDLRFFGSTGAPSLLIEELTLSGV